MTPLDLSLVLVSALLHAAWSVAMKGSGRLLAFNVGQVLATLPLALTVLAAAPLDAVPRDAWVALAGTAVAHGAYFYWLSRALETADLTLVYPIARSAPAFVPLAAVALLGEPISAGGAAGIAVVVAGMWGVHAAAGLRWSQLAAPGTGWAYATLAATVAYSLLDKRAMGALAGAPWESPVPRAVAYYLLLTGASSLVFVPLALRRLTREQLLATLRGEGRRILLAAGVSFASYGLILEALRRAPVSYVVAVRQTSVLFAAVLAIAWLRERPPRSRLVGAVAIVAGVAIIGWSG